MNQDELRIANRKAALRWGGFVVGLLSLQVIGGIAAIYLATGDASVAVVPDYHQKALNWDQRVELRRQSANLNWSVQTDLVPGADGQSLVIRISDSIGNLVPITQGSIKIYHHARAADVLRVPIDNRPGESIVVKDCFTRPGHWQIEIDLVDRQGRRFVNSQVLIVSGGPDTSADEPLSTDAAPWDPALKNPQDSDRWRMRLG